MPFKPSSWTQRTNVPALGTSPSGGHLSKPDGVLFITGATTFVDGPDTNDNIEVNSSAVTKDLAGTWVALSGGDTFEAHVRYFSIATPIGRRYFRIRKRFGRSFFISNSEIFAGYMVLDRSDNGLHWTQIQTFYSWPHIANNPGDTSRAQNEYAVNHVFLPGTGPDGADADWLLIRNKVFSGAGIPVDAYAWWRSDDYGESWINVRAETAFGSDLLLYLERSPSGRLLASAAAGLFFSDNNGLTWSGAGGFLPGQTKVAAVPQAGNTWCLIMAAGLASQVQSGISCDDGASWTSGGVASSAANANPNMLLLGPSEILVFARDSDTSPTGVLIAYSTDGGETWASQGIDTRIPGLQSSAVFSGIFPSGQPVLVGVNNVVLVSSDRPTGNFNPRTLCPLAFAALRKSGIPALCGHPLLTSCG